MSNMKVVSDFIAVIFTMLLLTGCYESDNPVLDKGEQSAMAGRFECKSAVDGSKEVRNFTEQKDGFWPIANYRYVDSKGSNHLLKKLSNGLVLAQSTKQRGGFQYVFLEFRDDKSFMLMIPDLTRAEPFVKDLAKKFSVTIENRGETLHLTGDKNRTMQFFGAHDRSIMTVAQKCDRVSGASDTHRPRPSSANVTSAQKGPAIASSQSSSTSPATSRRSYHYIDDTRPPDAWLALRSEPGQGTLVTIKAQLVNGTLLEVLERRADGWWRVYVPSIAQEGWVLNRLGNRVWVHCCRTGS